jgi:hypothetical protein
MNPFEASQTIDAPAEIDPDDGDPDMILNALILVLGMILFEILSR